ncbi:MAG: hypothetical protein KIT02_11115 [Devosia sp.]|uniref:glycine betaine ABC transporter substrate-binding protein n=1 Tax=Devosia sp. TaxID=1871048 RepID=UPI0024CD11BB|nr:glycine betaine ABC transporter substrate-binding protein [Devosia sp.]UYN98506.1 MAG: hypothetical protein KIT02_11115 [Devosia sp.]
MGKGSFLTAMVAVLAALMAQPAVAQFTELSPDTSVDAPATEADARPADDELSSISLCGTQPFAIARMSWSSAALLAEIHARLLAQNFGCDVRVTPGDLAATVSSMGSTGQPAMAPEMWTTRVADMWNQASEAQMIRAAAPTYGAETFEGWYMPADLAAAFAAPIEASALVQTLPASGVALPLRFISCPVDWACSVINRNLIAAQGLTNMVEIVEPANRFEMDQLIAAAVNRREPFLFYYWQPNAILAQLDFVPVDMGAFDADAAKCLASRVCTDPKASAFPADQVVMAVADRVFSDMPALAGYLQRATMPLAEMNRMLGQLNEPGATVEAVADRFVAERGEVWSDWVSNLP